MIVQAAPKENFAFLTGPLGLVVTERAKAIEAVDASGRTRGMVLYDAFTFGSCQAHMLVDSPIVWRSLLPWAFVYPFEQLGLNALLGVIQATNKRSLDMVEALGFRRVHTVRDGYSTGVDLALYEMYKTECRWLSQQRKAA